MRAYPAPQSGYLKALYLQGGQQPSLLFEKPQASAVDLGALGSSGS